MTDQLQNLLELDPEGTYWFDGRRYHLVALDYSDAGQRTFYKIDAQGNKIGQRFRTNNLWKGRTLIEREQKRREIQEQRQTKRRATIEEQWARYQQEGPQVRIVIFRCHVCRHAWRGKYEEHLVKLTHICLPQLRRPLANGTTATPDTDKKHGCPRCHTTHRITYKTVYGTVDPTKKCNHSCRRATSETCQCSCGGSNHGEEYEVLFDLLTGLGFLNEYQ